MFRFRKWARLHRHPYGEDIPCQRSTELFQSITEEEKMQSRYWVVRATGKILTHVLSTKSYTPTDGTAVTLVANRQPIIERFGSLPYATAMGCAALTLEADEIQDADSLTTLNSCYSGCVNLVRVVWSG